MFILSPALRERFGDSFSKVMAVQGTVYREKEGRRTVCFQHAGKSYFAKVHHGIGWREAAKNLVSLKLPVVDASNEWRAVARLREAGVPTVEVVGWGRRGWNPVRRESFVVMTALEERLEVEALFKEGAARRLRRLVVRKVAQSTRVMHGCGINHRDLYLCHFQVPVRDWAGWSGDDDFEAPVLDLHRALIHDGVPRRWLTKDLGALLYSALDCGVSDRELVTFLRVYLGREWKSRLRHEQPLWRAVVARAQRFHRRHRGADAALPGIFAAWR